MSFASHRDPRIPTEKVEDPGTEAPVSPTAGGVMGVHLERKWGPSEIDSLLSRVYTLEKVSVDLERTLNQEHELLLSTLRRLRSLEVEFELLREGSPTVTSEKQPHVPEVPAKVPLVKHEVSISEAKVETAPKEESKETSLPSQGATKRTSIRKARKDLTDELLSAAPRDKVLKPSLERLVYLYQSTSFEVLFPKDSKTLKELSSDQIAHLKGILEKLSLAEVNSLRSRPQKGS